MAGALIHPLRRGAGIYLLPGGLYTWCVLILLMKTPGKCTRVKKFLHYSAHGWALFHCRLSFLFLRTNRTSTKFSESNVSLPEGRRALFFQKFLLPIFAGSDSCFQFVGEERNEVCTDNVSVLRNRVFI